MDIYTLAISIILVLCGWVLFRSRDHVSGSDSKYSSQEDNSKKSSQHHNSGINDEKRARNIILESRRAIKKGDSKRAGEILKRIVAYPETSSYRLSRSFERDGDGLFLIASLSIFDSVFEEVLDTHYESDQFTSSIQQPANRNSLSETDGTVSHFYNTDSAYDTGYESDTSTTFGARDTLSVSYTHLTLPTIYSV